LWVRRVEGIFGNFQLGIGYVKVEISPQLQLWQFEKFEEANNSN